MGIRSSNAQLESAGRVLDNAAHKIVVSRSSVRKLEQDAQIIERSACQRR